MSDIVFGVRITADNKVFIDGVQASEEAVKKLGRGLQQVAKDSGLASDATDAMTAANFKAQAGYDILSRSVTEAINIYREMLDVTRESQQAQAALDAVIRASGRGADNIGTQIAEFAVALEDATGIEEEAVKRAAAQLLTFKQLTSGTVKDILRVAGDLSKTFGGDLETNAVMVAKAITETGESFGMLEKRLGDLPPSVRKNILALKELGDTQQTAKALLDEVSSRVGGAAADSYRGLEKQIKGAKDAYGDLLKAMGNSVFSAQSTEASILEKALRSMTETFEKRVGAIKDLMKGDWVGNVAKLMAIMRGDLVGAANIDSAMDQARNAPRQNRATGTIARAPGQSETERAAQADREAAKRTFDELYTKADRMRQMEEEITKVRRAGAKAGESQLTIDKAIAAVREKYLNLEEKAQRAKEKATKDAFDAAKLALDAENEANDERQKGADIVTRLLNDMKGMVTKSNEDVELWGMRDEIVENVRRKRELTAKVEAEMWRFDEAQQAAIRAILKDTLATLDADTQALIVKKDQLGVMSQMSEYLQRMAEEEKKQAEEIGQALTDALYRAFESGDGFGKAFTKTLMNTINAMVLRPIINPIANAVGGAVNSGIRAGASYVGDYAASALGYSAFGGAGEFAAGYTAQSAFIAGTAESAATAGTIMGEMGAAFAAIPVWGWAILGAAAIAAYLGQEGPAERRATFGQVTDQTQGLAYSGRSQFGQFGFSNFEWGSDADMKPAIMDFIQGQTEFENRLYARLSEPQRQAVGTALAGSERRYSFGTEHEDFSSQLLGIARDRMATIVGAIYPNLERLITGFEGTGNALMQFVQSILNAQFIFDGLKDKDPMGEATRNFVNAQNRIGFSLSTNTQRMQTLINSFDGAAASGEALALATEQYYNAQVQLIAEMEGAKQNVAGMFADTRRNIEMGGLTDQERYDYLQAEADRLYTQVQASTSVEEIERLTAQINQDMQEAFGMLGAEQQRQMRDEFLTRLDTVNNTVQQRIGAMQTAAAAETRTTMQQAAALWAAAGTTQNAAADKQLEAAGKEHYVHVDVAFNDSRLSVVNESGG